MNKTLLSVCIGFAAWFLFLRNKVGVNVTNPVAGTSANAGTNYNPPFGGDKIPADHPKAPAPETTNSYKEATYSITITKDGATLYSNKGLDLSTVDKIASTQDKKSHLVIVSDTGGILLFNGKAKDYSIDKVIGNLKGDNWSTAANWVV